MTATDSTPAVANLQAAVTVGAVDLAEAVRQAQAAGDLAYANAQAAGLSPEDCSDAYHITYSDTMRALAAPHACACDYCQTQATPRPNKFIVQPSAPGLADVTVGTEEMANVIAAHLADLTGYSAFVYERWPDGWLGRLAEYEPR